MNFSEYMIKKKKTSSQIVLSILLYVAATILALLSIILLIKLSSIAALLAFGFYYFAHRISSSMNKEFEYIFTNDNITIDVIMNASRRKRLISFSLPDVEVIAPIDDERYASVFSKRYDKVVNATSGRKDADVYCALISNETQTLIKFEPPYSALTSIQKYGPSKVKIKD